MGHKIKDFLKHFPQEVGNAIKKAVNNVEHDVSTVVKDVDNAAQWVALVPFKEPMKHVLDSRGISHGSKVDDIAKAFASEIILKEHFTVHQAAVKLGKRSHIKNREHFLHLHFLEKMEHLTDAERTNLAAAISGGGAAASAATGGISSVVAMIINAVMKWFSDKKKAVDSGAQVPADEQKAVNDADKATASAGGDTSQNAQAVQGRGEASTAGGIVNNFPQPSDAQKQTNIFQILLYLIGGFVVIKLISKHG